MTRLGQVARQLWVAAMLFAATLTAQVPSDLAHETTVAASSPGAATGGSPTAHESQSPRDLTLIKRKWGIEPMGVFLTSGNYMMEFKYRVLDTTLAKPVFERKFKPVLIDEATGSRFAVPTPQKIGALRNSNPPLQGRVYWMMFANPAQFVKPGSKVTIEIGDFRITGIEVR